MLHNVAGWRELSFVYLQFSLVASISFVSWRSPRLISLNEALYIEGGNPYTGDINTSFIGSDYNFVTRPYGYLYKLNLTQPFNATNVSDIIEYVVARDNIATYSFYMDGALFGNEVGFYSYGGSSYNFREDDQTTDITTYQIYNEYGLITNGSGITQNVSHSPTLLEDSPTWLRSSGGDVSVPSEHLGMFFSGLLPNSTRSLDLYDESYGNEWSPTRIANDVVICDTTDIQKPICKRHTLPDNIKPRAQSTAVWLPTGERGLIAIIGGTDNALDMWNSPNKTHSDYTSDVPVYDIATQNWHLIETTGVDKPPLLAGACGVLAESQDGSMFNAFLYGGYTGSELDNKTYKTVATDAVWTLSMPAFEWIKISEGNTSFRRHSHQCSSPYPNQMLIFGGVQHNRSVYLNAPLMRNLDLNTLTWINDNATYNPSRWNRYEVHQTIINAVGGSSSGGANRYAASMDQKLQEAFKTRYKGKRVHTFPYDHSYSASEIRLRGLERWLGGIIGLIAYLVLATSAFAGLVILRRRRAFQANNITYSTDGSGSNRIVSWMHNASPMHGLAKGLNINLSNIHLAGKGKSVQDEDYHPLKSPTTPYVDYSTQEENDADITSVKPRREPSMRSFQTTDTFTDSVDFDPGPEIEMRSFIDFREITDPHYPSDYYGYTPGP